MDVSLGIDLAMAGISPPIGTSQADPKPRVGRFTDDRLLRSESDRAGVNGYPTLEEMFEDMRSCRDRGLRLAQEAPDRGPPPTVRGCCLGPPSGERQTRGTRECWSTFRRPS
jgi:hypothetical protein